MLNKAECEIYTMNKHKNANSLLVRGTNIMTLLSRGEHGKSLRYTPCDGTG